MRRKLILSIKEDMYFLVYKGERKREVMKLGAWGLEERDYLEEQRKKMSVDTKSTLGPLASVRLFWFLE